MGVSRAFKCGVVALAVAAFAPACVDPPPPTQEQICAAARSQIVAALEAFKLAAGRYPVSIRELVPTYLAQEPATYVLTFGSSGDIFPVLTGAGDCIEF